MIRDSATEYGWVSIVLHWFIAATVITMYVLGDQAGSVLEGLLEMRSLMLTTGESEQVIKDALQPLIDERSALLFWHVSVGMMAFIPVFYRIYWRIVHGQKPGFPQNEFLQILARWVPRLLLVGVGIMFISGPMMVWTKGYPWTFFGLFAIPSPTGELPQLHDDFLVPVHEWTSKALVALFALHFLGVIKHLVINRDRTLQRMLRPGKD